MKILIIGGHGTLGKAIVNNFNPEHEVLTAGRNKGDVIVDIADSDSIGKMFERTGKIDAIICAAGEAKWASFSELCESDYYIGIQSKLMGQVNLVRTGQHYLHLGGSITLTTGILADDPVINTASAAMVNDAIHSFAKAVALEVGNQFRINAVSCGLVEDAYEKYKDFFPGHYPISMKKMLKGYERAVLGKDNGRIIKIYN